MVGMAAEVEKERLEEVPPVEEHRVAVLLLPEAEHHLAKEVQEAIA